MDYEDALRREVLDEATDLLRSLSLHLEEARHGRMDSDALKAEARKAAFHLRSQSNAVQLSRLATLTHRFEDYLSDSGMPSEERFYEDLQVFVDLLLDLCEGRIDEDVETSRLVRRLPPKRGMRPEEVEVRDVEVLLVMAPGAQAHFVERELQQCGYRTSVIAHPFDALPLIVRGKPDLVIVSGVLPDLDGIDLAVGLTAMPETRNIPLALITSLDDDNPHLQLLPARVPVIHKGSRFGDDLFQALDNLFLI